MVVLTTLLCFGCIELLTSAEKSQKLSIVFHSKTQQSSCTLFITVLLSPQKHKFHVEYTGIKTAQTHLKMTIQYKQCTPIGCTCTIYSILVFSILFFSL